MHLRSSALAGTAAATLLIASMCIVACSGRDGEVAQQRAPHSTPPASAPASAWPAPSGQAGPDVVAQAPASTSPQAPNSVEVAPPAEEGPLLQLPMLSGSYGHRAGLHKVKDDLRLSASAALVIDQDTGQVLLHRNEDAVLPIASLTKLMTGLVITEAKLPMEETLTIVDDDVDSEKHSRSRLRVGTSLSRREALQLALMSSENRAAHALGRTFPGGLPAFVQAMNRKAKALGMKNTTYAEPTGLSTRNQSTARDLALVVNAASMNPLLTEYTTTRQRLLEVARGRMVQYNNSNRLIKNPKWDIELQKTGYIVEAGWCMVLDTRIAGRNLVLVLLDASGAGSRIADVERIKRVLSARPKVVSAAPGGQATS
jgi:serine-type D-Ala-D-Ala endopeptidase (penicillin-binding protein 7)